MKDSFVNMMKILKHGGQIDVVARIDGKDYRWECDGLQHAVLLPEAGRNHPIEISLEEASRAIDGVIGPVISQPERMEKALQARKKATELYAKAVLSLVPNCVVKE